MARWCSGLTHRPVKAEIVGSNPIRVAISCLSDRKTDRDRINYDYGYWISDIRSWLPSFDLPFRPSNSMRIANPATSPP